MKANIIIRQPVNTGSMEAMDLIAGDKIVCRRCGEGVVTMAVTPAYGEAISPPQFQTERCEPIQGGKSPEIRCHCGGLLVYSQPVGGWF
jgi:hypothetical protein